MGQRSASNSFHCKLCNIDFLNYMYALQWFREKMLQSLRQKELTGAHQGTVMGTSAKTSWGSAAHPSLSPVHGMAYLRGSYTSRFIYKSGCICFTPGRAFVLSKPSFPEESKVRMPW